jgi:hypothetical protein
MQILSDQQSEDATTSTEPTTDFTDDDLVDDIMGQFDVDFDTLCIHVAERKQEELKAEGKYQKSLDFRLDSGST